jgi:hypothetical protein
MRSPAKKMVRGAAKARETGSFGESIATGGMVPASVRNCSFKMLTYFTGRIP